jgi:hypothetical protein
MSIVFRTKDEPVACRLDYGLHAVGETFGPVSVRPPAGVHLGCSWSSATPRKWRPGSRERRAASHQADQVSRSHQSGEVTQLGPAGSALQGDLVPLRSGGLCLQDLLP